MSDTTIGQRMECRKCGHAWNTRTERRPVQCPRCKSTNWDRERVMVQRGNGEWIDRDELWEIQKKTDWSKAGFGGWGDMDETVEEILDRVRQGW